MRVLLDESLPRQLARELIPHDVRTVRQQGWAGLKNGALLRAASENGFEIFVTADQNLQYQQNVALAKIGIIVLIAPTNRLIDLQPFINEILTVIPAIKRGQVVHIENH